MQDSGFEFSREFDAYLPPFDPKGAAFHLNSLENLTARWRVLTWNNGPSSEFGRGKQAIFALSLIVCAHSCHPPVTLVTLEKGCRRPVHRHSVTLTPFIAKNPYCARRSGYLRSIRRERLVYYVNTYPYSFVIYDGNSSSVR